MSTAPKSEAVVIPTKAGGVPDMAQAAGVQKMAGGGLLLSPLPLGGGKRRGSRKVSKKVKAIIKKMTPKQLKKMMKGGEEEGGEGGEGMEAGRRRRGTKKTRRASRKSRARKYF